jgi:uncharacterized membrane protein (UPF0182 family)
MTTLRTLEGIAPSSTSRLRVSLWRTPRTRSLLAIGLVVVVSALVALAAHVYTDFLWFREMGQQEAFWTTLKLKVMVYVVVTFGTATFLLVNFAIVQRVMRAPARQGDPRVTPTRLWAYRNLIFPLAAIAAGLAVSAWEVGNAWQSLLLWQHRGSFGFRDPLFHRDVGYFVFSLPLYQHVAHWLYVTFVMAGVGTVAGYVAAGAIRRSRPLVLARAALTHLLGLGALLLVLMAWRYRLDQFRLALPHSGVVPGATYTDVHVQLPMLRILVILSLAGALLCLCAAWLRARLPLLVAAGVVVALLGITVAGRGAIPALVQTFQVEPQELSRERPYVSDGIAFTARAYQLDRVSVRSDPGNGTLSPAEVAANRNTLDNVSLWDSSVLRSAMDELQSIGEYYSFPNATVDRYTIGGKPQLVTLGARQLDLQGLKPDARSWANERFAYTHGYGVVATKAQEVDSEHQPGFAESDLRFGSNPLRLREPRVYFGQKPDYGPPYTVLRTSRGEVEDTAAGTHREYHYGGTGGIPLSNPLRRAAFALRFGDPKLLLTQTVSHNSRIVLHRDARDRLQTLAPFLRWDTDPQTAVIDGRVKFLFHGYTTSSHFPYSEPVQAGLRKINYMRDAAQAEVDAFSGSVNIYAASSDDPVLRAWQSAYPSLFQPVSQMPAEMRAHLRYPQQLFKAQIEAYTTYHVRDATRFWTAEDAWQQSLQFAGPVENAGEINFPNGQKAPPMQPAYQLMRLPGDVRERFMIGTAFTPRGRQNLAGYLTGSLDRRGSPRLTLLNLPRDRLTIGPTQATRRILANSGVSSQLNLLNRESRDLGKSGVSRTVLGVPRVVPVGDTLLYVQPFYLIAGLSGIPRLQLVAVHVNGRVGYGRDLMAALRGVVGPGQLQTTGGKK